ncbi:MAG: hypothetical protein K6T35_13015, partial [Meiothermus silvanus]|nr:hypothetical protein [Allomeiothermus silvanus]
LPMWANYRLIPVWTAQGQPMYVNASVMPVLFFQVGDPAPVEHVLAEAARLPGPHPLALIAEGFPAESLAAAEAQVRRLSAHALHGAAVLLLQGPDATYGGATPRFVYLGRTAAAPTVVDASRTVPTSVLEKGFAATLAGVYQGRTTQAKPSHATSNPGKKGGAKA